jgi:hypothetical protein
VTCAQDLPTHAAASNAALKRVAAVVNGALPLPESGQAGMTKDTMESLAHRIRPNGQPTFSTTPARDATALRKLVMDTYMNLRDQLINRHEHHKPG